MTDQLPHSVQARDLEMISRAVSKAATCLHNNLCRFGYPNGGRDAPLAEHNVTYALARALEQDGLAVYLELPLDGRNRIDLVVHRPGLLLAVESKTFGNVPQKARELYNQLERLRGFSISSSNCISPRNWDDPTMTRIGVALVAAHCDESFACAWDRLDVEGAVHSRLRSSPKRNPLTHSEALHLLFQGLRDAHAAPGSLLASKCAQWMTERDGRPASDLYLLWAAFAIPERTAT